MGFISNDEIGKERASFYKVKNDKGYHQAVSDLNPEYDLMGYRKIPNIK
jgi:hypothetical protein